MMATTLFVSSLRSLAQAMPRAEEIDVDEWPVSNASNSLSLNFKEFEQRQKQTIYVSATPNVYETQKSKNYII